MALREVHEEIASTQARAVELARGGADDGARVVARRQTDGRGRGDRRWSSPDGGLYLSVVLRPAGPPGILPLAIGAELAAALGEAFGARVRLKWPNDLLAVDGGGDVRKLAGVLVDLVRSPGGGFAAVAGIGVNARRPDGGWPDGLLYRPVALEELTGAPVDLRRLEDVVAAAAVAGRRALTSADGDRAEIARCRGLLYGRGETVTVDGVAVGALIGLSDDGALEVAGPDGPRSLFAGDVRVGVGR